MEIRSNRALCLFTVAFFLQGHQTWQFEEDSDGDLTRTRRGEPNFPGFCPDGWYTFGEMCYKIGTRTRSWESALRDCKDMDSHLVSIHNQAEQDFVNVLVMEIRSRVWIGLRRKATLFEWEDSSPPDYTNWAEGEPNNEGNIERCAEIRDEHFAVGKWNDVSCRLNKYYICEKPKDPNLLEPGKDAAMCPNKKGLWFKMRDSCYKIFHRPDSFLSWSQAQSLCQSYGGNLAYIKNTAINKLLEINTKGMQGPFWTGVKRSQTHQYTWLGKGYPLIYSNWQTDLPNEIPNGENCVAMDAEGEWIIRDCEESHPFICETGPERGFLASLHSDAQKRIIMNYIKYHDMPLPPVYIGLFMDRRGSYRWSDGSAYEFSNWDNGEPNNLGGTQICGVMQMTDGRWSDVFCSETFGFICSILKIPQRENLIPKTERLSPKTKASKPAGEEAQQLSSGRIAMIVVSCLLVLAAVSVVSLYYFGNSLKAKVLGRSTYSGVK